MTLSAARFPRKSTAIDKRRMQAKLMRYLPAYVSARLPMLAMLAGLGVASPPSPAAEPACGPYQLAYFEFGSFYYKNEKDDYVGIDKDVVVELARRSGCVLNGFLDSRVRTWTHLADGALDMSVSAIPTPEREKFAVFIPYYQSRNYVLMRKDAESSPTSLRDFLDNPTLRLAVVKSFKHGTTLDAWIDELRAQQRVDDYADTELAARALAFRRADAILSQPVVWAPLIKRNKLEGKLVFHDWASADRVPGALVLSKSRVSATDIQRIRKHIEAMRADGTLERIFARHVPKDIVQQLLLPPERSEAPRK